MSAERKAVTTRDVLRVLIKHGPISCANLGAELWHGGRGAGLPPLNKRGYGNCSCPFARPAGRLVQRLVRDGLAERHYEEHDERTMYKATRKGERAYQRGTYVG